MGHIALCLHTKMCVEICMVRVLLIEVMMTIYKISRHHIVSGIPKLLALVSLVIQCYSYINIYHPTSTEIHFEESHRPTLP